MNNKKSIEIRMESQTMKDELKKEALKRGLTVSDLVRCALNNYCNGLVYNPKERVELIINMANLLKNENVEIELSRKVMNELCKKIN